ncbi:nuclear transport factor 2 family protein [Saccharopolyspora shandongensis]|uniref:nuclear transport factor 2 family protein n=1 Tax=Saccharopolyspora shandongensis TaxID=418495 RepID=UPI0033BFF820
MSSVPADATQSAAEELLAISEIQSLFAKRLRVMDTKQWDRYAECHTDDVVSESYADVPDDNRPQADGQGNKVVGAETLTKAISGLLDGDTKVTTVHHGHMPEIELTSPTTARGIWAMEDELWWQHGDVTEHMHGYGHYHEEYRKVAGRWRISYRKLTRLRVTKTPGFFSYLRGRL